jgi:hypothetical protein
METVQEYTPIFVALVYAVINAVNALTKHWSETGGSTTKKVVMFLIEMLSMLASKNDVRSVKLPGQVVGFVEDGHEKQDGGFISNSALVAITAIAAALFFLSMAAGCAGSWSDRLSTAIGASAKTAESAWNAARPVLKEKCMARVMECVKAKDPECPALRSCQDTRKKLATAVAGAMQALADAQGIVDAAASVDTTGGALDIAKQVAAGDAVAKAVALVETIIETMRSEGVIK